MPERGTIFSLQTHKRAQFSLVEVYERGGKGTIKGLTDVFYGREVFFKTS